MKVLNLFFFLLSTIIPTSIAMPQEIHALRPRIGSGGRHTEEFNCLSWRLAVETDNIRNWKLLPKECKDYVGHYMLGYQYRKDCNQVATEAYNYAKGVKLARDGKDIWVFDLDETSVSNLPYYARPDVGFGAFPYNNTSFEEWEAEGKAPAVPGTVELYKKLVGLGFKIVFLSGKAEKFRTITEANLKQLGYYTWEKLILKGTSDQGETAVAYKSKKRTELVKEGYRIRGNMGDQWSDLIGSNTGDRGFKVPDPMYYIS